MQHPNGKLITAAEYARLRGLNRSTISRQIASGAIPTVDGLLDPRAADLAREKNLNGVRKEQAARRKAEHAAKTPSTPVVDSPKVRHSYVEDARGAALREMFETLIAQSIRIPAVLCEAGVHDPVILAAAPDVFLDAVFALAYDLADAAYDWCGNDDRSSTPTVDLPALSQKYGFQLSAGTEEQAEALAERINAALGY
jgi:hypothetical protein